MADFEKVKATIVWSGDNVGLVIKEGIKVLDWDDLTREEQIKFLNGLASMYELFRRFLKDKTQ